MELDRDASFWGDAHHRSLSVLLVDDLPTQPEAPIDPANHSQHRHQAADQWTV